MSNIYNLTSRRTSITTAQAVRLRRNLPLGRNFARATCPNPAHPIAT
jgi:hypothetical protein